jgi:hypothetical protein
LVPVTQWVDIVTLSSTPLRLPVLIIPLLTAEAASIAFTARLKSLRLLMAQASSNEAAWCAASIIAFVGLASGCSAANASRRYLAGSTWKSPPSASAMAWAIRSTMFTA